MLAANDAYDLPSSSILNEAAKDAAVSCFVHHRGVNDDGINVGRLKRALQVPHHPGKGFKGTKWRLFRRYRAACCSKQPTTTGVDELRFIPLGSQMQQGLIEQAALDFFHRAVKIGCYLNHGIHGRKGWYPVLRLADIASNPAPPQ